MGRRIDNRHIAWTLARIADMLEFRDENQFKVRSYRMASEALVDMQTPLEEMVQRGGAAEVQKIPGIGKSISNQIVEILESGESSYLAELTRDIPETVLDLRKVSGIGLKTAQLLYRQFAIKSLEELKYKAESGGLVAVPGLGEKTIERIKRSIARLENERGSD